MNLEAQLSRSLLDADLNARYFKLLTDRLERQETCVHLCLGLLAAGAAATRYLLPSQADGCQAVNAAIAILLTAVLPYLRWKKHIPQANAERIKWTELRCQYENLAHELVEGESDHASRSYKSLLRREQAQEATPANLPFHARLRLTAEHAVLQSRGMASA